MMQRDELTRVKARIKALTEKTVSNGCTEAEAMAAAEMAGRLLERYALTMDEIEIREARCVQAEIPLAGRQRRPIDGCVPAIARFCGCKVWLSRDAGHARYVFFGFESDVSLATYLFAVIERGMQTELDRFRQAQPGLRGTPLRQASISYQQGMASRLAQRLETMLKAREAEVHAQRSDSTALMVVKHRAVEEAFRETTIRLVAARRTGIRPGGAYREGYVAGDRVNLNRPVSGKAHDALT
ncbi:hypothetical protein CR162_08875 [Pseudoroseomonas rhizosphaerae]|uniref:Uncharacterized protein n=1 Tax=Teichococcus rhizosphaerae TaxID=1335062 RepID=A0A2C7AC85_9PROT|nr:DUF2786 domain-containing protein [Pseudoroseomonas rhizosphaerae]PHK95273.1 hypothetical protein CR162_08875 [Pseudoroseomonas rhizosphaerae]